ncbi:hypothetical protein NLC29_01215 [Candidatus Aminicenantes bacterium AH-873-B07]|nr:hypothetical protein [Candidatus Aminicenantes bacterium AH-873-B07]
MLVNKNQTKKRGIHLIPKGKFFLFKVNREKIAFALLIIFVVSWFINIESHPQKNDSNIVLKKKFLLLIDFVYLNCPPCMQSLIDFINIINSYKLENSVLGVLIYPKVETELDTKKHAKIIEKQLRGFTIGNDIKFPIILDKNGIFNSLNQKGVSLILFDIQDRVIKKYKFPLRKSQINEIFFQKHEE